MNGESLAARATNGARSNNRAVAATAGRSKLPTTLAAQPWRAPPPSGIAGQMRASHRRAAATLAAVIEGGALDGIPIARGAALLAPASGLFAPALGVFATALGLLGRVETRLPSSRAGTTCCVASLPDCCVASLPELVTEPTEFLAMPAIPSAEGTLPPELGGDGEGVGASSVCNLTGAWGAAGAAIGAGGVAGGTSLGSVGAAFGGVLTASTVDPTLSVTSPTRVADATGAPETEPIRIAPATKTIRRHRRCSNAIRGPFVRPRFKFSPFVVKRCRNFSFYPIFGQIYLPCRVDLSGPPP
jgi:hypothetical protein